MSQLILQRGQGLAERYVVENYVGEGGMQQVYRAADRAFDRPVVIKVPKNESAERRFARSAEMSARVNHPNIAKTLDYFEEHGRSYLVEELVEGRDLGFLLSEHYEYLDPHLAAHVVHHLATGLAAAHHAKVFHRDLKPSNVMVSDDPGLTRIKITDFGIAKMAEEEISDAVEGGEDTITSSQTALGALPYMAPELIEKPRTAGQPADVWSIGALLYHLVSGSPPFGKGLKVVHAILEAKPPSKPDPFQSFPQFAPLTDDLWAIILSCLQKDSAARPDADQLVRSCSELCYADTPRVEGQIVKFGQFKGKFGFIMKTDGSEVFFHKDSLYGSKPTIGMRVNLSEFPGSPRSRAYPVLTIRQ